VRALIPRLDFDLGLILFRIGDLVLLQKGTLEELKTFIKTEVKSSSRNQGVTVSMGSPEAFPTQL